jgi:deoxyribodipyrimidine photo-lyase
MSPVVVWFRRDLRLDDNPALVEAAATGRPVVPVYVLDDRIEGRPLGGAARWWLDKSLRALATRLESIGSRLVLRSGESGAALRALLAETGAGAVYWNTLWEPPARARDDALSAELARGGVEVRTFNASLLAEPGSVLTGSGEPYKVFTPFWRALRPRLDPAPRPAPRRLEVPGSWPASERIDAWGLHPTKPDWSKGFVVWTPGEQGAAERLDAFVRHALSDYPAGREIPGAEGSSRLSPHLHWGEISPNRVFRAVCGAAHAQEAGDDACEKLLSELGWRDFSAHLLHHFPHLPTRAFKPAFDRFPFRRDPTALEAWRRGRTGYPIVDAGLRQLWTTGWMHNRVRMIVSSFLVKDLLIDWREGEAWFWDTLVDADQATNAASWQWIAGSGVDAAPFFRVYNPVTQGEKFDPEGAYVRKWAPELADLPDRLIHAPWTATDVELAAAGIRLGETYPRPIVDHARARERALAALRSLKEAA